MAEGEMGLPVEGQIAAMETVDVLAERVGDKMAEGKGVVNELGAEARLALIEAMRCQVEASKSPDRTRRENSTHKELMRRTISDLEKDRVA